MDGQLFTAALVNVLDVISQKRDSTDIALCIKTDEHAHGPVPGVPAGEAEPPRPEEQAIMARYPADSASP